VAAPPKPRTGAAVAEEAGGLVAELRAANENPVVPIYTT